MALKAATKDKLKTFGLDPDKLIEAVKAEAEVDYAIPEDVTVLKTTELETRDANNKASGKTEGLTEGEKKGKEIASKAFKKKFNLDEAIPVDVDRVVEAVNTKLNKGDAGLQEQITLLQKDKEVLNAQLENEKKNAKASAFDAQLISFFPANRLNDISDAERLALVKMNLSFEEQEGKTVVKKGSEILRDKNTQSPLEVKDAINNLFTERKWVGKAGEGGRGGEDNPPPGGGSGIKTMSKLQEKWKAENPGKDVNGPEFQTAAAAHAKENKDFNWYE